MIKVILLLIYLLGGELKVEQTVFETAEDCNIAGNKRAEQVMSNPSFEAGIFAGCIQAKVQEARK